MIEYLQFYVFLTLALEKCLEVKENVPYANSNYCHLMLKNLVEKYGREKYEYILHLTNIHKLSYKLWKQVYSDFDNNIYHIIVGKD